jgi:catechol 2,3-dioxygenase-like lactoylglutathione lyase family enzyme
MKPRIHLVTLGVADLARARRFYEQDLGWPVSSASVGDIVFLRLEGLGLALYPRGLLAEDAGQKAPGAGFSGITFAQNVAERGDVDALLARVEKSGGKITRPAHDAEWGGRSGYFADPDGYLWEIAWNPGFPFAADGSLELPR